MGRRAWRDDEAVSEVVGTVLLVAISILLFAGLSLVVWQQMQTSPLPANVDLRTDVDGEWVGVTHTWGESLPVAETRFLVTVGGTRSDYRLDEEPLAGNLTHEPSGSPDHWDLGETLWLACPLGEACAFPGQKLDSVTSVDARANAVVFSTLPGVTPGLILNPLPDLVVATEPIVDLTPSDAMFMNDTYRFRAVVGNTGLEPVPDGATIITKFYLDGDATVFPTHSRMGPLPVGSTYVVEFDTVVSGAGSHTFKAVVDEGNTIAEIAEENVHQRSFILLAGVADPGFAFEDGNDDGFYNPYVTGDADKTSEIMDGNHGTSGTVGIVIPPSAGPISVAAPISFTPGGSLTVGVNLTAAGSNSTTLNAGNEIRFVGSPAPVLTATGPIDIDAAGDIVARDVRLAAEGHLISLTSAAGSVVADGLAVPAGSVVDATRLEVRAAKYVAMANATVHVTNAILIQASGTTPGGSLLVQDAMLEADPGSGVLSGDAIRLNGNGDVHVERVYMRTTSDLIGIHVTQSANTLYLTGLDCDTLAGTQNTVVVSPTGTKAGGTTTQCTVVGVV